MTITLTAALILTLAGFLLLLDRKDERAKREREADRAQVQYLLQRIQAPQAAVYEHHAAVTAPEPSTSPLPMTDEEMAEMQNSAIPNAAADFARLIARMEAAENGPAQIEDGLLA